MVCLILMFEPENAAFIPVKFLILKLFNFKILAVNNQNFNVLVYTLLCLPDNVIYLVF